MNAWLALALKGSVLSALAFVVVAGCGDDGNESSAPGEGGESAGGSATEGGGPDRGGSSSTPDAGEPASGGTGTAAGGSGDAPGDGGTATTLGGSDSMGGQVNGGGAGGEGGGDTGRDPFASVARFCNGISEQGTNVTFILEIGEGDEKVTFTADSFTCAPPDGDACVSIPLGLEVPVALYEQGDPVPWFEGTIFSEAQDQWLFFTDLLPVNELVVPTLDVQITNGDIACDDTTYEYVYPPS